jgi:hypothetical protein
LSAANITRFLTNLTLRIGFKSKPRQLLENVTFAEIVFIVGNYDDDDGGGGGGDDDDDDDA